MNRFPTDPESLQRLLALKRRETPPPGYFVHFSGRVIAQIENETLRSRTGWWKWLEETFQVRPILACAASVVVVAVSVFGYGWNGLVEAQLAGENQARRFEKTFPLAHVVHLRSVPAETDGAVFEPVVPQRTLGLRSAREAEVPGLRPHGGFGSQLAAFYQTR